jgi:hypothetical protein
VFAVLNFLYNVFVNFDVRVMTRAAWVFFNGWFVWIVYAFTEELREEELASGMSGVVYYDSKATVAI